MDYRKTASHILTSFSFKHLLFGTFDSTTLGHGLNKTCERILMMIWHHQPYKMQELSRDAGLEKGSVTSIIDILETRALASRIRSGTDRRSFLLQTTDEGALLAERIEEHFFVHLEHILSRLSEEDRIEFEAAAETFAACVRKLDS